MSSVQETRVAVLVLGAWCLVRGDSTLVLGENDLKFQCGSWCSAVSEGFRCAGVREGCLRGDSPQAHLEECIRRLQEDPQSHLCGFESAAG